MAIVGITWQRAHVDHKPLIDRRAGADLGAQLIAHQRLAFGDAIHLGFAQGVDLATATLGLMQQRRNQRELADDPVAQRPAENVLYMAQQFLHGPALVTFLLFQRLAHALGLPRMGVAAHLQPLLRNETGLGLPQPYPD